MEAIPLFAKTFLSMEAIPLRGSYSFQMKPFVLMVAIPFSRSDSFNIGLSPSKKVGFLCFYKKRPSKKAFNYFMLNALFVLKIFTFLS